MSEPVNKPSEEAQRFGERLHGSWSRKRKRSNTKGMWYQIALIAAGIILIAAMIYLLATI